jgi:hypothetical protein
MIGELCPLSALKVTTGEVRSSADIRTSPSNVDQTSIRMMTECRHPGCRDSAIDPHLPDDVFKSNGSLVMIELPFT